MNFGSELSEVLSLFLRLPVPVVAVPSRTMLELGERFSNLRSVRLQLQIGVNGGSSSIWQTGAAKE
jgi:hypothetical protein